MDTDIEKDIKNKVAQLRTKGFSDDDINKYILESLKALYTFLSKSTIKN